MNFSKNSEFEKRADKCMNKIKTGVYNKRTLSNTTDDFDLDKASEGFKKLVNTELMKKKINNT